MSSKISKSQLVKRKYLNSTTLAKILQLLGREFPKSLQRRRYFVLWGWDQVVEKIRPYSIGLNSNGPVKMSSSMTKNLCSLNKIKELHYSGRLCVDSQKYGYGIAINLKACSRGLILIDFDDIDIRHLETPLDDDSDITKQLYHSLRLVPSYREISASGNGIHVLFMYDSFQSLTSCEAIDRITSKVEVFLGGRANKLLILTGHQLACKENYKNIERYTYRSGLSNPTNLIVPATHYQLEEFLRLVNLLRFDTKPNTIVSKEDKLVVSESGGIPQNFSSYYDKKLRLASHDFPIPEKTKLYKTILPQLDTLAEIIHNQTFDGSYKSWSEVDFAIFSRLVKLYHPLNVHDTSSIIFVCLKYYTNTFPYRKGKSVDYLTRTCYKLISNYHRQKQVSHEVELSSIADQKTLIKTPRGMLAEVSRAPFKSNHVCINQRDELQRFDWDVYHFLLWKTVESYGFSSVKSIEIRDMKCQIEMSIGDIARGVTSRKKVSVYYYTKVSDSLERLSRKTMSWNNSDTQGSVVLLEYIYNRQRKTVNIKFTDLIAWCLLVSGDQVKNSVYSHVSHYGEIFNLYKRATDREIYRYLINNSSIRGTKKLPITESLLQAFYKNYASRRYSFYKNKFIESLKRFASIKNSDMQLVIERDEFTVIRSSIH